MKDNRNATSSWSGYNHQGKVGIFLALTELRCLIEKGGDISGYSIEFESAEDIDIKNEDRVISRHQVKAKKNGKYPNDYANVLALNSLDTPSGFNIAGVEESSRYLHTIREVKGFGLTKEEFDIEFHKMSRKPKYVENESRVRLYRYPNDNLYCPLAEINNSPMDDFCKEEIKKILKKLENQLAQDDEHIEGALFEIKDVISKTISKAHISKENTYPIITFQEIFEIVISTEKKEHQSIHRAKTLFEIYWNKNFNEDADEKLFSCILNLPINEFQNFLIDLHPQKSIKELKENLAVDSLLDEDIFEEIFYEFFKTIDSNKFNINELRYCYDNSSYRLSLINKKHKKGQVGEIIQSIINNRQFLRASFDVDYLINGRINSTFFDNQTKFEGDHRVIEQSYSLKPDEVYNIFSNTLEFIDIDKTLKKLSEEQNE